MKHFLFGIVFSNILFPIFDDIAQLLSSILEIFVTALQKKSMNNGLEIAKLKKQIEKTIGGKEPERSGIAGFANPLSLDDDDEDEEEEEE